MSKRSTVSRMKLSIIIPCYNEEHTLKKAVSRIFPVDIGEVTKEIIIIDDGSTDRSVDMIHELENDRSLLFDLKKDPGELNNLFDKEKERGRHLRRLIQDNLKMANERIMRGE